MLASERPVTLLLDERGRLHSHKGPAIAYSDGWGIYASHGVRLEPWVIDEPAKITPKLIDEEANAEVRRVMIERFGAPRYMREGGAILVHEDKRGKLWRKERAGDTSLDMIEVVDSTPQPNGEAKTYYLRVKPGSKTASAAVAWTFGLESRQYRPTYET